MDHGTMTDMVMSGTATMTMASSTLTAMSSMQHSSMMPMSMMEMTFFASAVTPLFSAAWVPDSAGQYAGTCIFLVVLSTMFRGLLAVRGNLSHIFASWRRARDPGWILTEEAKGCPAVRQWPRWKLNDAVVRAVLDTVLAALSYLLMIAVMTMNVGYFLSVLGGAFLGSFVLGGWAGTAAH